MCPCEQLCGISFLHSPLPVRGAQWAVGCHGDALRAAVADQLLLGHVWVAFDLGRHKQTEGAHGRETLCSHYIRVITLSTQTCWFG